VNPEIAGNRLSLDFVNLSFSPGDARHRPLSWQLFIDFLATKQIISAERSTQLEDLAETDPHRAATLLGNAERLSRALRESFSALLRGHRVHREWVDPVNQILRVTEGHDELALDRSVWKLEFVAKEEGLEWLLAAIARSGAELISSGTTRNLRKCGNPSCQLLFYDHSRTLRRRWCSMALCGNRSKVAAFARRRRPEKARAHHP
jgi:predicted RNA-binding Zn ribbon-like protein